MVKNLVSLFSRFIPRHLLQNWAAFFLRTIAFVYSGNKFEDPITGKRYRKLLPYGRIVSRPNALAPHSLSLERHRLLWLYLKERTGFFTDNLRVLHIAPEYCFLKPFKALSNLQYITADLVSPWADIKLDVRSIQYPDSSFNVIICNHVLEHIDDEQKAMSELYRVMAPGGFGIFQVPLDPSLTQTLENPAYNTPALREKHYGQRDHVRLYGTDYAQRLRSVGFTVVEDSYVKQLTPELVQRYALPKDEIIYLCKKS